jgi:hypothetical protein
VPKHTKVQELKRSLSGPHRGEGVKEKEIELVGTVEEIEVAGEKIRQAEKKHEKATHPYC